MILTYVQNFDIYANLNFKISEQYTVLCCSDDFLKKKYN
jgi:hypothetical protein